MQLSQRNFLIILGIVAFFTAGVFASLFWDQELKGDGLHYSALANSLIEESSFSEGGELNSRRDPGYPFFLAAIYSVFGFNLSAVYIIQILMFAGISLVSYFLVRSVFEKETLARLSAIITALYYPLAMHAGMIFTEILFTFLLLVSVYLIVLSLRSNKLWMYAVAGLILGAAALTRSVILYLPIFLFVSMLIAGRKNIRKAILGGFLFLLLFTAVVTPWMVRNFKHFDQFTISTQSGPTIFFAIQRLRIKNSDLPKVFVANTLGDFFAREIFGKYNRFEIEEGNFGQKLTELSERGLDQREISAEVKNIAVSEIKLSPLRYLLVVPPIEFLKMHTPIFPLNSVQGLFSDSARYQNVPDAAKALIILSVRIFYWAFFAIVIYAIIKIGRNIWSLLPVYAVLIYIVGVYSILHGIPRYALPIYPLYIMLFSFGILYLIEMGRSKLIK